MSKSFMDAIRGVVTEGAREKTADGMTKDAAHFRKDLHPVKDAGFKHMVQKDSETKDYEKMFSGNVDKAPARLADQQADKDLDKYVEYNEHLEIEEAKKKGCSEDCDCEKCSADDDDKEEVKEDASSAIGSSSASDSQRRAGMNITQVRNQSYGKAPTTAARPAPSAASTGPSSSGSVPTANPTGVRKPAASGQQARTGSSVSAPLPSNQNLDKRKLGTTAMQNLNKGQAVAKLGVTGAANKRETGDWKGNAAKDRNDRVMALRGKTAPSIAADQKAVGKTPQGPQKPAQSPSNVKVVPTSGEPPKAAATPPKPTPKPQSGTTNMGKPGTGAPQKKPVAPVTNVKPAAPRAAVPGKKTDTRATPQSREAIRRLSKGAVGPEANRLMKQTSLGVTTGKTVVQKPRVQGKRPGMGMKESISIDVNGTSYLVSEAHASAIAAFVEKYGVIDEMSAGEFISKEMKHPEKLTAKTRAMKIKQAFAIYKSKERRGEKP